MPYVQRQEVKIHYEVHGDGFPVLLISGLGGGTWSWYGQIPYFQTRFRTIVYDNRGAGLSSAPNGPYTIREFAEDADSVLTDLGVERACVMGLSMGGMIAQELALLAPEKIVALVLGCTNCGGAKRIPPIPEVLSAFIDNEGLTEEQIIDKNLPFFFSSRCLVEEPDLVDVYRSIQLNSPVQSEAAFRAQMAAIGAFDCSSRLGQIAAPTLVVAGTEDRLVPFENARILAEEIPKAQLVELKGAGHAIHAECKDRLNSLVDEFFSTKCHE